MDEKSLREVVKEYLKWADYTNTLPIFEEEEIKKPPNKLRKTITNLTPDDLDKLPKMFTLAQA
jgi:hypothetical protein